MVILGIPFSSTVRRHVLSKKRVSTVEELTGWASGSSSTAYGTWRRAQIVRPSWWGLSGVGTKRIEGLDFRISSALPPNGKMTG